jgi:hypothetical protein
MPVLADDDVVVHGDPERPRYRDDRLGHFDVGARRCRVATWVVVQQTTLRLTTLNSLVFRPCGCRLGTWIGDGNW